MVGFILVLTGAWYTNNEKENPAVDKIQKSANKFVDWILIMVGWLLILWTIIGWFTLVKKSRELDIICVFLNITMMLLQVKFLCILFASNEFRERKTRILVAVFLVSLISSAIHLFIFIIKYRTQFTLKENQLSIRIVSKTFEYFSSMPMSSLASISAWRGMCFPRR